ncbi:MAG: formate dehydrogenase accessory sulfurtransferase FdhD [Thermoanaerobaculia bacterium]
MEHAAAPVRAETIRRFEAGTLVAREDRVTVEEPLEIRVGAETLAVTMRTPGNDFELAAGWLLSEGIVHRPEEIVRLEHCREVQSPEEEGNVVVVRATVPAGTLLDRARRLLVTTSSCGLCGKASIEAVHGRFPAVDSPARVSPAVLAALPGALRRAQTTFGQTGGLHGAGIFALDGRLLCVREDVGRHNAVDKAIGALFREGRVPLSEAILLVSGRTSFEIVQKAVAAGIPIVAAVSAPSSLAIDLARGSGVALIGFLREGGFNLYSGEERVDAPSPARSAPAGPSPA